MRQRLGLAQALLGDPQILLLDEPSNGLDPEGQEKIQQIIQELRQDGKTIVISTHQLQEVTEVCTDLIIIKQGEIHYRNTMQSALAERPHATIWLNRSAEPLRRLLASIHADIDIEGQTITLNREALFWRRQVIRLLLNYDYDILGMAQKRITLSEIYGNVIRS
jgi:ABC-2 type transport system ATP-binding protein